MVLMGQTQTAPTPVCTEGGQLAQETTNSFTMITSILIYDTVDPKAAAAESPDATADAAALAVPVEFFRMNG